MKTHSYLHSMNIHEFHHLLEDYHIYVDQSIEERILQILRNNMYAIDNKTYSFVLEKAISSLTQLKDGRIHTLIMSLKA